MNLFNKLIKTNRPETEEVKKFKEQIKPFNNTLSFEILTEDTGWSAQCNEIPGILTGGTEVNPQKKLIEERMADAISCAFDLPSFSEIGQEVDLKKESMPTGYRSSFDFSTV